MIAKNTIETFGYILKEEKIASLKYHIIPGTLVFEIQQTYPGYHGPDLPGESVSPEFIFFVTKNAYSAEHIFRVTERVVKYFGKKPDIAPAEITVYNNVFYSIRIRGCKDFTRVIELQTCFKSEGIEFARSKNIEANGLIKVHKTFSLIESTEGIYEEPDIPGHFYIQLPLGLNWEQFRVITMNIKRNIESNNFDAALGLFFRHQGIIDFVRIYDKESTGDKLLEIKERYHQEIKKILLDTFK